MSRIPDDEDYALLRSIEKWKETAAEQFYDIEAWRNDADKRDQYAGDPTREWQTLPNGFYSATVALIGRITARYPKLDSSPLMTLYDAIATWDQEHSAATLPPQGALTRTADLAMMVLQAVEIDLQKQRSFKSAQIRGPISLTETERDIIDVIREIGPDGDRSQKAIFDALSRKGKIPSTGTTKVVLAAMVRHGILLEGYRLPEWQ